MTYIDDLHEIIGAIANDYSIFITIFKVNHRRFPDIQDIKDWELKCRERLLNNFDVKLTENYNGLFKDKSGKVG